MDFVFFVTNTFLVSATLIFHVYSVCIIFKDHKTNRFNKKRVIFIYCGLLLLLFTLICLIQIFQIYFNVLTSISFIPTLLSIIFNILIYLDALCTLLYAKNIVYVDKLLRIIFLVVMVPLLLLSIVFHFPNLSQDLGSSKFQSSYIPVYTSLFICMSWMLEVRFIHHMVLQKKDHSDIMAMVTAVILKVFIGLFLGLGSYIGVVVLDNIQNIFLYGALVTYAIYLHKKYDAFHCLQEMSGLYKVHVEVQPTPPPRHTSGTIKPLLEEPLAKTVSTTIQVSKEIKTSDVNLSKDKLAPKLESKVVEKRERRLTNG